MKALITGACGFIGSHLARKMAAANWTVVGVDNLSRGCLENIADLKGNANFKFIQADVASSQFVTEFSNQGFNAVVHFACGKGPRYGSRMEVLETNAIGAENALEVAHANKARFIYGSTGELYGKNPEIPFTEESSFRLGQPVIQRWSGVVSQMYAEHLCFAYNEKHGLDFTIIRFFNIYGPGQSMDWMGGPQAIFIKAALEDKPMEIHGDGVQSRDLSYIDDAIDGVLLVLESQYASEEIINIGDERRISIVNLAYMIWRLSGNPNKPKLEFLSYAELPHLYEDIRHRSCDTTKARCLLGHQAKIPLEDGLRATIQWHRGKTGTGSS
ncbi:MAG: SDR family NAD(P)-dependent oxidoreductase [Nitrospinae bacterium]|nr:SDR family NAD(P)-dependent oxidoreductase [Nitrospinota bacterium]